MPRVRELSPFATLAWEQNSSRNESYLETDAYLSFKRWFEEHSPSRFVEIQPHMPSGAHASCLQLPSTSQKLSLIPPSSLCCQTCRKRIFFVLKLEHSMKPPLSPWSATESPQVKVTVTVLLLDDTSMSISG